MACSSVREDRACCTFGALLFAGSPHRLLCLCRKCESDGYCCNWCTRTQTSELLLHASCPPYSCPLLVSRRRCNRRSSSSRSSRGGGGGGDGGGGGGGGDDDDDDDDDDDGDDDDDEATMVKAVFHHPRA